MWSPVSSWGRHLLDENETGWRWYFELASDGTLTDDRDLLLDLSIFGIIKCIDYQNIEFEMDKKESATSNSDRDRRQRRLREIKTKGIKKSRSLSTQRFLSAKITIAMRIYSWSTRYCRDWTESLFETSKRIEEAKWSWATCWTSWWEIVSEIS